MRTAVAALLMAANLRAGRALLECTADTAVDLAQETASGKGRELAAGGKSRAVLLDFRTAVIEGWTVEKATLLLHIAEGAAPRKLELAAAPFPWSESETAPPRTVPRFRAAAVRETKMGWIEVDLGADLLRGHGLMIRVPGKARTAFHARETVQYSPYLIVEGSR
jgi:hypothetical protein